MLVPGALSAVHQQVTIREPRPLHRHARCRGQALNCSNMDALPEIYSDDMVKASEYRWLRSEVGWRTPEHTDDEIQRALNLTWNATARTRAEGRLVGLVRVLETVCSTRASGM
jgi:hypothetical protein